MNGILAELAHIPAVLQPIPGTVSGALAEYNRSSEFLRNARSTQASYQSHIDELCEEAGDLHLSEITAPWLRSMSGAWALRGHRVAALRMQILKNALKSAMVDGRVASDVFVHIEKPRAPHDRKESHPTWHDAEVDAFIALALERHMPGLARAVALGRWGGFRRGTICTIPLAARTSVRDEMGVPRPWLNWLTEKRKVLADKPEDARLTAVLQTTANRALTIAYNRDGEPWKPRQLNQAIERILSVLAKRGEARRGLTIHGLRHSRGVELAIAGASDAEIMSQLEHSTVRAAQIYRRQADRRRMAESAQAKIDNIVNLRPEKEDRRRNQR